MMTKKELEKIEELKRIMGKQQFKDAEADWLDREIQERVWESMEQCGMLSKALH